MPRAAAKRERRSPPPWSMIAAAAWLILFVGIALTLELPNNPPLTRGDILGLAPGLIDLIDPPPLRSDDSIQSQFIREHSGWRYFPQRFDPFAVAALILAGAWGAGHLLLRAISALLPPLERTVFAFGLGLAFLSLLTLLAGVAGVLSRLLLGSVILIAFIAECALQFLPPLRKGGGRGGWRCRRRRIAMRCNPP